MRSTVASASSAAARPRRSRPRPGPAPRELFSISLTSAFAAYDAGAMPKTTPVTSVRPTANASTIASMCTSGIGSRFGGSEALIARTAHTAPMMPPRPPKTDSVTLSTSSWRSRRMRDAPSAVRTAISFCRAVARASSRLAMFAQAMSSTKPTAARRTRSAVSSCGVTNVSKNVRR